MPNSLTSKSLLLKVKFSYLIVFHCFSQLHIILKLGRSRKKNVQGHSCNPGIPWNISGGPIGAVLNDISMRRRITGFIGVQENLESPGILFWHFPVQEKGHWSWKVLEIC